ncbi:hypothetical protein A3Q56_02047 [Intoshia linei]|uniref:Uncharacterized protein n=1 Tax=Intoshia linei TaxID=1819745 RepID=A0A177B7D3_9BILA|nr:hypothetical protein A3Q56_02047 [Intoshia linei]
MKYQKSYSLTHTIMNISLPSGKVINKNIDKSMPINKFVDMIISQHHLNNNQVYSVKFNYQNSEKKSFEIDAADDSPLDTFHSNIINIQPFPVNNISNSCPEQSFVPFKMTKRIVVYMEKGIRKIYRIFEWEKIETFLKTICKEENVNIQHYNLFAPVSTISSSENIEPINPNVRIKEYNRNSIIFLNTKATPVLILKTIPEFMFKKILGHVSCDYDHKIKDIQNPIPACYIKKILTVNWPQHSQNLKFNEICQKKIKMKFFTITKKFKTNNSIKSKSQTLSKESKKEYDEYIDNIKKENEQFDSDIAILPHFSLSNKKQAPLPPVQNDLPSRNGTTTSSKSNCSEQTSGFVENRFSINEKFSNSKRQSVFTLKKKTSFAPVPIPASSIFRVESTSCILKKKKNIAPSIPKLPDTNATVELNSTDTTKNNENASTPRTDVNSVNAKIESYCNYRDVQEEKSLNKQDNDELSDCKEFVNKWIGTFNEENSIENESINTEKQLTEPISVCLEELPKVSVPEDEVFSQEKNLHNEQDLNQNQDLKEDIHLENVKVYEESKIVESLDIKCQDNLKNICPVTKIDHEIEINAKVDSNDTVNIYVKEVNEENEKDKEDKVNESEINLKTNTIEMSLLPMNERRAMLNNEITNSSKYRDLNHLSTSYDSQNTSNVFSENEATNLKERRLHSTPNQTCSSNSNIPSLNSILTNDILIKQKIKMKNVGSQNEISATNTDTDTNSRMEISINDLKLGLNGLKKVDSINTEKVDVDVTDIQKIKTVKNYEKIGCLRGKKAISVAEILKNSNSTLLYRSSDTKLSSITESVKNTSEEWTESTPNVSIQVDKQLTEEIVTEPIKIDPQTKSNYQWKILPVSIKSTRAFQQERFNERMTVRKRSDVDDFINNKRKSHVIFSSLKK